MKNELLIACAALLLARAACALSVPAGAREAELLLPDGAKVTAELALTPEAQERGLMFRETLAADRGMLFVFPDGGIKYFWMKNTFVDLDMVYLDAAMKVVKVFHRVPRSAKEQPESEIARVSAPASCVLELASGVARAHRVRPGSVIRARFLPAAGAAKKSGGL
jgi:hypothetical protein